MSVRPAYVRGSSFIPCYGAGAIIVGLCEHVVPQAGKPAFVRVLSSQAYASR